MIKLLTAHYLHDITMDYIIHYIHNTTWTVLYNRKLCYKSDACTTYAVLWSGFGKLTFQKTVFIHFRQEMLLPWLNGNDKNSCNALTWTTVSMDPNANGSATCNLGSKWRHTIKINIFIHLSSPSLYNLNGCFKIHTHNYIGLNTKPTTFNHNVFIL